MRDSLARLTYVVPFVPLVDVLWPLGRERRSLRDRMVGSRVVQATASPRRALALTVTAITLLAAWLALSMLPAFSET